MQFLTNILPTSPPPIGLARRNISRHLLGVVVTAMAAIAVSLVAWNLATQRRFGAESAWTTAPQTSLRLILHMEGAGQTS